MATKQKCQALNDNLRQCSRPAVRSVVYFGNPEHYQWQHEDEPAYIRAWFCDKHSKPERRKPQR